MLPKTNAENGLSNDRVDWWSTDFLKGVLHGYQKGKINRMIDLGCGHGHWSEVLLGSIEEVENCTLLDIDHGFTEIAVERLKPTFPNTNFNILVDECGCLSDIEKGCYDLVTCQTLLMHVTSPENVIREMFEMCKPNGLLVISEPLNTPNMSLINYALANLSPREAALLLEVWASFSRGKKLLDNQNLDIALDIPDIAKSIGIEIGSIQAFKNPRILRSSAVKSFIDQFDDYNRYAALEGGVSIETWEEAKLIAVKLAQSKKEIWSSDALYLFIINC